MMHSKENSLTFTMPLTLRAREAAQQFRQRHSDPQKAKQVYLNTLAVQAVNSYLRWFDIETDLEGSDSWNLVIQSLSDVADLTIENRGKLECRPVLPGEQHCQVPPEVWEDRIGYVAVQFDADLSEATLLGYVPSIAARELPLSQLRSLEDLLDHLDQLEPSRSAVNLGKWLQNTVIAGWKALEELEEILTPQQLAFNFRNAQLTTQGKLLNLGTDPETDQVALLVGVMPSEMPERGIRVAVCPSGSQTHLPPDLEVMVLDQDGTAVMQAQARNTDMIELQFSGLPGEHFSIKVVLDTLSFTEAFVI